MKTKAPKRIYLRNDITPAFCNLKAFYTVTDKRVSKDSEIFIRKGGELKELLSYVNQWLKETGESDDKIVLGIVKREIERRMK